MKVDKTKPRPMVIDSENPAFTAADFERAQRAEDIPALAHLAKRKKKERVQRNVSKTPAEVRSRAASDNAIAVR